MEKDMVVKYLAKNINKTAPGVDGIDFDANNEKWIIPPHAPELLVSSKTAFGVASSFANSVLANYGIISGALAGVHFDGVSFSSIDNSPGATIIGAAMESTSRVLDGKLL
jgi:hypothetical protein